MKLQHTIIRASAGSGKTYQLANRFIALLLLQAAAGKIAPEKLVAVTFTRKGAGEFAHRILDRLAKAAGDEAERRKLQADLELLFRGDPKLGVAGLAPGVEVAEDAATLQRTLAALMDEFDRLALGTIDSFMARSVETLAFELGLGGFDILDEPAAELARQQLLAGVFRSVLSGELEVFYQTLKLATLRSSSNLRHEVDEFVKGYHKLLLNLPDAVAWGGSDFWNGPMPEPPVTDWKSEAAVLAGRVPSLNFGHKTLNKSLTTALEWLSRRNPGLSAGKPPGWLDREGKLQAAWLDWPAGEWKFEFFGKERTIPASVMTPLRGILAGWLAAESRALATKTQAIYRLLSRYEVLYDQQARRKGRLSFNDLPVLLDEQRESGAGPEAIALLAFRWFQQFDHWLLDEFQDTSRVQWEVLKPWLDEAIQDNSGAKSVFVVGDSKQSIYGWRGGEPRLFDELSRSYPGAFSEQTMAQSWRSRPAVLALVNLVCSPDNNPALRDPEKFCQPALQRWRYEHHTPEPSRAARPGYAAVLLTGEAPDAGDLENENAAGGAEAPEKLAAQAQVIKSVLAGLDPLAKGLSCAILTRTNKNAQAVAQWLRRNDVPNVMVEGDATLAEQSPIVAALVDALRWLDTPAHTLAAGHIQATPLWEVLAGPAFRDGRDAFRRVPDVAGNGDAVERVPTRGHVWRYWRLRISEIGAGEVTREWCSLLAQKVRDDYSQYCLRQVDQLAHQVGPALTLPDWLATLEQLTVRETAAAGSIHVMTIHKAKGLGFDVVFLPDLDRGGAGQDDMLLRRDSEGCIKGCLVSPPKWLQAWVPEFGQLQAAQDAEQDLEALCVLYVALTRAKEATFVILQKEKPRRPSRAREWLLGGIGLGEIDPAAQQQPSPWGEGQLVWERGSSTLAAGAEDEAGPCVVPTPDLKLATPLPRRERRRPSDAGHAALAKEAPLATAVSSGGQEFGTAVHVVFEQIEWWEPGQPGRDVSPKRPCLAGSGRLGEASLPPETSSISSLMQPRLQGAPDAVAAVQKCLEAPEIRALFQKEAPPDEACRELPVELIDGNVWWSGVVDRLVLRRSADGTLRKAVLVDFKTDNVAESRTLRDRYSEQLAVYRRAIALALKLTEAQVETVLVSTHLRQVVAVAG